jgi:hypothetical protein
VSGFHLQEVNGKPIGIGSLEDGGFFEVILNDSILDISDQMSFTDGENDVLTISGRRIGGPGVCLGPGPADDDGVDTSAALTEDSNLQQDAMLCKAPVVCITKLPRWC